MTEFSPNELATDESADDGMPTLCFHTKRREWGRALRVNNRDGRVAYQFEDGGLRVIAPTHAHLLERARLPATEALAIAHDLRSVAGLAADAGRPAPVSREPTIGLVEQVALFRDDYPEGFADAKWNRDVRGEGVTNPLKRHRDHVIALAGASLGATELEALLEKSAGADIVTRMADVLAATDLATAEEVSQFRRLHAMDAVAIGMTLRQLLVGDKLLTLNMQRFFDTLKRGIGGGVRWQLATALPALIDPLTFPWVRPAAIREQAKSMTPTLRLSRNASGALYSHVCHMIRRVSHKLGDEGMAPQDLMDVTDFCWATLRPTARKRLAELLAPQQNASTAETEAQDDSSEAHDDSGKAHDDSSVRSMGSS